MSNNATLGAEDGTNLRTGQLPTQQRALKRVETILAAASALIAEFGVDQVGMQDIANRSQTKMSAIYRYFPNKAAILSSLYQTVADAQNEVLLEAFRDVESIEAYVEVARSTLGRYLELAQTDASSLEIVQAVRANSDLRHLDIQNDYLTAETIAASVAHLASSDEALLEFERLCFLSVTTIGPMVRAAAGSEHNSSEQILSSLSTVIDSQIDLMRKALTMDKAHGEDSADSEDTADSENSKKGTT